MPDPRRAASVPCSRKDLVLQSLTMDTVVGDAGEIDAPDLIRERLRLPPRARVFRIERTRHLRGG